MNENSLRRFAFFAALVLAVSCLASQPAHAQSAQAPGGKHFPLPEAPGGMPSAGQQLPQQPGTRPPVEAQPSTRGPGRKTPAGEEFFIVASIDLQRSQMLLKRPTEVTLLARADDKTQFLDETGKPIKLSNLRAGDTVWVVLHTNATENAASKVRKGQMTVADLHRYYLDYPEIR